MENETQQKTKAGKEKLFSFKSVLIAVFFIIGCYYACKRCGGDDGKTREHDSCQDMELGYDLQRRTDNKGKYYIVDAWSEDILLDGLDWFAFSKDDSLAAFSQQNRRGYFNFRQRTYILLPEKFIHVYMYNEGRALAESLDSLYILNTGFQEVARYAITGERDTEVNTFHKGYLPMLGDNGKLGLIDTCGCWRVKPQYDKISWALEEFWTGIRNPVMVDEETGQETPPHRIVMDSRLRTVMEGNWTYLMVTKNGYITVGDENHWQWHYSLDGKVIDDFVCKEITQMTYTTGEKKWVAESYGSNSVPTQQVDVTEYATLLKYTTSDDWEGLMTREGKVVTPPLFWTIEAINKNLYLCKYDKTGEHGILLNEKGERIKK